MTVIFLTRFEIKNFTSGRIFICDGPLTAWNTLILPDCQMRKFFENAQFPQSFEWIVLDSAETMRFHKICTPGN